MNDDLISRDAVLDACSQSINILDAMSRIEDLPSVTPKQKTGYWISHENDGNKSRIGEIGDCIAIAIDKPSVTPIQRTGHWEWDGMDAFLCSECASGYKEQPTMMGKPMFEYCPICGAKMEEQA